MNFRPSLYVYIAYVVIWLVAEASQIRIWQYLPNQVYRYGIGEMIPIGLVFGLIGFVFSGVICAKEQNGKYFPITALIGSIIAFVIVQLDIRDGYTGAQGHLWSAFNLFLWLVTFAIVGLIDLVKTFSKNKSN